MKATKLVRFLVLSIVLSWFSSRAQATLTDGLIAYWSFDNCDATDDSGYGRHGTIMGTPECVDGARGKALSFQGEGFISDAGDHVLIPMIDFNSMQELSICLWAREDGMTNASGEAYIRFGIDPFYDDNSSLGISHINTPGHVRFHVSFPELMVPFNESDLHRFTFYCLVYENSSVSGYRNAGFLGSMQQSIRVTGSTAAIARHWWGDGRYTSTRYIGAIDEVRIYNRALSEEELQELFVQGLEEPKCNGNEVTIWGTDSHDILRGTNGPDVIHGLRGHDVIWGDGGDDIICGGRGNDTIGGGPGDDVLRGGKGNDNLLGDDGNDDLYGGHGHDVLAGQDGDDVLVGSSGNDTLQGGGGFDECYDRVDTYNVKCEVFEAE